MTRHVGIISDTHDELQRTMVAVKLLRESGAEVLIHCGDLIEPPILEVCSALPLWFVFGNNDSDMVPSLEHIVRELNVTCLGWGGIVEVGGKRIGVTH